jgi:hypothetical protein
LLLIPMQSSEHRAVDGMPPLHKGAEHAGCSKQQQ